MKTKQLLFLSLLGLSFHITKAQVTQSTNAITATSYVGTSNDNDVTFKRNTVNAGLLSTDKTSFGVNSFATSNSVSIGVGAGQFSSGTGSNMYIGRNSGGGFNSTISNSGTFNTYLGNNTASYNSSGTRNTFIGHASGQNNNSGSDNIAIGVQAGPSQNTGNQNIFIGNSAGCEDQGTFSNSILIGYYAGFLECASDRLVIDNGETQSPIIWGDLLNDRLKFHAKVGIGGNSDTNFGNFPTTAGSVNVSNYNLFVRGGILTEEVRITLATAWADYVFNKNYNLKPLNEVETFINANGHLPNVPSAQEVKENGIELGEMAKIQQEKIEELTLYVIEQNKINQSQANEIEELKAQMKILINRK